MIAQITSVANAADGSFTVTYEFARTGVEGAVAAHTQGFPAGTDRATVEEAIRNFGRDVLPNILTPAPVAVGDTVDLSGDPVRV
jgi:hypothetical protein